MVLTEVILPLLCLLLIGHLSKVFFFTSVFTVDRSFKVVILPMCLLLIVRLRWLFYFCGVDWGYFTSVVLTVDRSFI